jgi:hypothetical protein
MATGDTQNKPVKSDFMAAEEIRGILHGREKAEQERIIRWASESLNLTLPSTQPTATDAHLRTPLPAIPPLVHTGQPGSGAKKDIKAFVEEKKPKSAVHFVTVVAYFHHFEAAEKKETIVPNDVQEAARLCSRPRFETPTIPLNNAVGLGYLDRVEKSTFKINAVGENLVAMALPGSAAVQNGGRKPKKAAHKKKPKKQVRK